MARNIDHYPHLYDLANEPAYTPPKENPMDQAVVMQALNQLQDQINTLNWFIKEVTPEKRYNQALDTLRKMRAENAVPQEELDEVRQRISEVEKSTGEGFAALSKQLVAMSKQIAAQQPATSQPKVETGDALDMG